MFVPKLKTEYGDAGFKDWRGNWVWEGSKVLFAYQSGHCVFMAEGTVAEIRVMPDDTYSHPFYYRRGQGDCSSIFKVRITGVRRNSDYPTTPGKDVWITRTDNLVAL